MAGDKYGSFVGGGGEKLERGELITKGKGYKKEGDVPRS